MDPKGGSRVLESTRGVNKDFTEKQPLGVVHPQRMEGQQSVVLQTSDDMIALEYSLRHLRAGGGDCVGRSIARWSSFMHVSVYLEAEPPCQFPVFQTTHFGALALVRLLFHELLGLQLRLRRLLRWTSIGAREGFYLLCSLLLGPRECSPGPP